MVLLSDSGDGGGDDGGGDGDGGGESISTRSAIYMKWSH